MDVIFYFLDSKIFMFMFARNNKHANWINYNISNFIKNKSDHKLLYCKYVTDFCAKMPGMITCTIMNIKDYGGFSVYVFK